MGDSNKIFQPAKRVGMKHAAFGACELGRQLRRNKWQAMKEASNYSIRVPPKSSFNSMKRKSDQRPLLVEMLETERLYVDALHAVVSRFLLPLQVSLDNHIEPLMSKQDLSTIFGNIAQIFEVNIELLRIIEENIKSYEDDSAMATAFAKAFTNMLPVFKAFYSVYANNYEKGIEQLEECRVKNPTLDKFLKVASKHPNCHGLDLSDFLIKPVQRICKYPLFFRGLLECTKEDSPMHGKLKEASEAVNGIAQRVNQTAQETVSTLRAFEVAAKLEGLKAYDPTLQVVEPGRKLLLDIHCNLHYTFQTPGQKPAKKGSHPTKQAKPRECFVFNDVILIVKQVGDKLEFRFWLDLRDVLVTIPPHTGAADHGDGNKGFALDIVRIRVLNQENKAKATRFIENVDEQTSDSEKDKSDKGAAASRGQGSSATSSQHQHEMSIVEKYSLWCKSSAERSKLHNLIVTLQSELEENLTRVSQMRRGTEASGGRSIDTDVDESDEKANVARTA